MINSDMHGSEIKWKRHSSRKAKDAAARLLGYLALGFMLAILISIFAYIIKGGAGAINWNILSTYGNTSEGGLLNGIIGTWELVGMGLLFSLIPGVFGAIYLTQAVSNRHISGAMRLFTDILTSVPSIVIGLFGYLVLVIRFNLGYSLVAGGLALGVMMLPYIMRITEMSFRNIQSEQIMNAYALGADHVNVATRILLPQASAGILSGILLSVSIAAGETAQLLYTASFNSAGLPSGLTHSPVGYLTYFVWNGINQPSAYAHNLAFISAMILIISVTVLIFISKYEDVVGRFLRRVFAPLGAVINKVFIESPPEQGVKGKSKGEKEWKK